MTKAVWCVRNRDGWCARKVNYEYDRRTLCVLTACGWFVHLPHIQEKRIPTCPECLAAMEAKRKAKR